MIIAESGRFLEFDTFERNSAICQLFCANRAGYPCLARFVIFTPGI